MTTIAELEAYMDSIEERYFALYPNPSDGERINWGSTRDYIRRVKDGAIPGLTLEAETARATQTLVGFRRMMGEELHPRKTILKRQQLTRTAAAARAAAAQAASRDSEFLGGTDSAATSK